MLLCCSSLIISRIQEAPNCKLNEDVQGSVIYTHTPVFIITAQNEYRYISVHMHSLHSALHDLSTASAAPYYISAVTSEWSALHVGLRRLRACIKVVATIAIASFLSLLLSASPHSPLPSRSRLCTFLETILTMVWYPSCVATLSRYTKVRARSWGKSDDPPL
jgi:hypothetical protein